MSETQKFKAGDRVRSNRVFVVQSTEVDAIGQIAVGRGMNTASIYFTPEELELVDDPARDPVGTVRRSPTNDSWYLDADGRWRFVWHPAEAYVLHGEVKGWPIIGAVPGTPAGEARE